MSYFMIDTEADGPIPGDYSMVAFAAILVRPGLEISFSAHLKPISDNFVPEALSISGFSREETLGFEAPAQVMQRFVDWVQQHSRGRPHFVSDNPGFDWMFICWYLHHFVGHNPFGHSSTHLGSLYKGLVKDCFQNFKHLRQTQHTHDPLDDARGNAEALLSLKQEYGLKIKLN